MAEALATQRDFVAEQTRVLREGLVDFLKAQTYDLDSLQELQTTFKQAQTAFEKFDAKLTSKKESLFKDRKIEKWKLEPQILVSYTIETLFNNKPLALSKMLPQVCPESEFEPRKPKTAPTSVPSRIIIHIG
jgi:hypothetical protein